MEDLDLVEALRQLPEDGFADVVAELVQDRSGEVDAMFDDSTNLINQTDALCLAPGRTSDPTRAVQREAAARRRESTENIDGKNAASRTGDAAPCDADRELPGAALTEEAASVQIEGILRDLGPAEANLLMRRLRARRHPPYVPLEELTTQPWFEKLLAFFMDAAGCAAIPAISYAELVAVVEEHGFRKDEILSEIPEERWNRPSPGSDSPGRNRHHLASKAFLDMIKRKSQTCCYGTSCPILADASAIPTARGLTLFHFDHIVAREKEALVRLMFAAIGTSNQKAAEFVAELAACQLVCGSCHDYTENNKGNARRKLTPSLSASGGTP